MVGYMLPAPPPPPCPILAVNCVVAQLPCVVAADEELDESELLGELVADDDDVLLLDGDVDVVEDFVLLLLALVLAELLDPQAASPQLMANAAKAPAASLTNLPAALFIVCCCICCMFCIVPMRIV